MKTTYILFTCVAYNEPVESVLLKFDDLDNAKAFLETHKQMMWKELWDKASKMTIVISPKGTQRKNVWHTFYADLFDDKEVLAKKVLNLFL